jgi:ribonucleotide reductase beta subunit family protein with ferritin-like domain
MSDAARTAFPSDPEDARLPMFPIYRRELWSLVETARRAFWQEKELSLHEDRAHFRDRLTDGERHFIKHILAFFAIADSLVNTNILERFIKEVPYKEATAFYNMQAAMEDIHNTAYSMMLDEIISDSAERARLFDAAAHAPAIRAMTGYIERCAASNEPIARRMLRMTCAEGILFSGAFCAIYWFRSRALMPGLAHANEFIARDEGLHTSFSIALYRMLPPLPTGEVQEIFREAVDIAIAFACDALPTGMRGMNSTMMSQYIQYVADGIIVRVGESPLYGASDPFPFTVQLNMDLRDNFFETKSTQYGRVAATNGGAAIKGASRYDSAF